VIIGGVEIAKDGDTFRPLGKDRIAYYSKTGKRLAAPLPKGWDPGGIAALALTADRAEVVPMAKTGGTVTVDVPAGRPVMLFGDGQAARESIQKRF
jgi:hypothetical protein